MKNKNQEVKHSYIRTKDGNERVRIEENGRMIEIDFSEIENFVNEAREEWAKVKKGE